MSREIIVVDADDTILAENDAIRRFMNDTYGFRHTPKDYIVTGAWHEYWERIWQLPPNKAAEAYQAFLRSDYKRNLSPLPQALPVLTRLKAQHDLVVATARGKDLVDITHRSLAAHYPGVFKDVHFVPLWGNGKEVTKAQICKEIGASYIIDDNLDHCRLAAEVGIKALVFGDYGWNRVRKLPPDVTRCYSWPAVDAYFRDH